MECQECHMRPATLHFTKVINGQKIAIHICEQCAQEQSESQQGINSMSLQDVLSSLLGLEDAGPEFAQPYVENKETRCPHCGMTYRAFAKEGKFGCEHCYHAFSEKLQPIFKRVHGGHTVHKGKVPKRGGRDLRTQQEIADLRKQLKHHVEKEEFEQAADIRDYIYSLEKKED